MKITAGAGKKQPSDRGQHRIAKILVQRRHRIRLDAPAEAVPHDELVAFAQLLHKGIQRGEVVAVIRIAHDDELAARALDAAQKCGAIAAGGYGDDARPTTLGQRL